MEIYMNIMSLTAVELGKRIKAKEISVEEAVTAALDAIEKKEKLVNSFVTVDREGALKRAKEVQKQIDARHTDGAARRCTGCHQRQYVYERSAYHLFF